MINLFKGFSDIEAEAYYFVSAAEKVPDAQLLTSFTPEQALHVGEMLKTQGALTQRYTEITTAAKARMGKRAKK